MHHPQPPPPCVHVLTPADEMSDFIDAIREATGEVETLEKTARKYNERRRGKA